MEHSNRSILAGIETEYGLLVEGRSPHDQVDDAIDFVRSYPGKAFVGWDYRYESPRADLRGFVLDRLAFDPADRQFERPLREHSGEHEIRSDRVLPNGARFYNDHGHPEYATPECRSINLLSEQDAAGELVLTDSANAFARAYGRQARVYKNNTDFHGASYGTHESYLAPRSLGFDRLFKSITPMLVARQVLTGAGKVGSESGRSCAYQISQRADFFVEPANAETLFRRPVFNTRDEPHAPREDWIRLHVICGDANMISTATARKVGLIKLALLLAMNDQAPNWGLSNPVEAFQAISRDESYKFEVSLQGRSWTTAYEILESYFAAAEATIELDDELAWTIESSRQLLKSLTSDFEGFGKQVDWAAKRLMLETVMDEEGTSWNDPNLVAYDLEYHNIDREDGLFWALEEMGRVERQPSIERLQELLTSRPEDTRARARGLAVERFSDDLLATCWRSVTFRVDGEPIEVQLRPDVHYAAQLADNTDVGSFIECLRGMQ